MYTAYKSRFLLTHSIINTDRSTAHIKIALSVSLNTPGQSVRTGEQEPQTPPCRRRYVPRSGFGHSILPYHGSVVLIDNHSTQKVDRKV